MKKIILGFTIIMLFIVVYIHLPENEEKELLQEQNDIQFFFKNDNYIKDISKIEMQYMESFGKYYLFCPWGVNLSRTYIETNGNDFLIEGQKIDGEDQYSFKEKQEYRIEINGVSSMLMVLQGSCENVLFINTESGDIENINNDKEYEENATILAIRNKGINYVGEVDYIKGRGNASWEHYDKKPYALKFNEKTKLFGIDNSSEWILLPNYVDRSLLKNKFMYDLAREFHSPYAPDIDVVDIYINGEYHGLYNISEKVEISPNSIDIFNLEKENKKLNDEIDLENPELYLSTQNDHGMDLLKWTDLENEYPDYSGGYLIEQDFYERYNEEKAGFVSDLGFACTLKEPDVVSFNQLMYIKDYYQEFEDALFSDSGYNELGNHYSDYVDVDSLARMFILQEFSKNVDIGTTSSFLFKDTNGKLVIGPIWDMDNSLGCWLIREDIDYHNPEGYVASTSLYYEMPTIFSAAYQHLEFREYVIHLYNNEFKPILKKELEELIDISIEVVDSAITNSFRWNFYGDISHEDSRSNYLNYEVSIEVIDFINERIEFLDKDMKENKLSIIYKANGGESTMFNPTTYDLGESVEIKKCDYTHTNLSFDSWNTKADGSGTTYRPNDVIKVEENTVLYAIWK